VVGAEGPCCPRSGQVSDEGCASGRRLPMQHSSVQTPFFSIRFKIQPFLPRTSPTQNLPFWTSHHCYSILAKPNTSLRWGIPAHTDPAAHAADLRRCIHTCPMPCVTFVALEVARLHHGILLLHPFPVSNASSRLAQASSMHSSTG